MLTNGYTLYILALKVYPSYILEGRFQWNKQQYKRMENM